MIDQRIRFVTRHYAQLQGLRLVPLGLFLLGVTAAIVGALDWLPGMDTGSDRSQWLGGAALAAITASALAPVWYRNRFGSVTPLTRQRRDWTLGLTMAIWLLLSQVDGRLQWPILLNAALIAIALTVTVVVDGWLRWHYLVAALAWFGISLLPSVGVATGTLKVTYFLGAGLTLLICGIGDHRLITSTLRGAPSSEDGLGAAAL